VSPEVLGGRSEVNVKCRGFAEVPVWVPSPLFVGGTTVPEPDDSSVSMAEVVSMAGVVTRVPD
jgi:hypothetical protein